MKKYQILGHFVFIVLIIYAIRYALYRIIYIDPNYQILEIINTENFTSAAGRLSMYFTQILPLIAIKIGASLKTILTSYSLNFILLMYASYIIAVHKLKNDIAGIAMIITVFLIRDTFFHGISETFQAMFYTGLFYAWINYEVKIKNTILKEVVFYGISFAIILLNFFIHPVTLFLIGFALLFTYVDVKKWLNYKIFILGAFILSLHIIGFLTADAKSHNASFFKELYNFKELLPNIFSLYSTKYPIHKFWESYFLVAIIYIFSTLYYLKNKNFAKLLFFNTFYFVFLLITCIIYHKGDADLAMERSFLPLAFFIGLPFAADVIVRNTNLKTIKFILLSVLILFSLWGIKKKSKVYRERYEYVESLIEQTKKYPETKFVYERSQIDPYKAMVQWGIGIESLMISAIKSPDSCRVVYIYDKELPNTIDLNSPKLFLSVPWWKEWNSDMLNKNYFRLKDGSYRDLNPKRNQVNSNFLYYYKSKILSDQKWKSSIEEKAKQQNISIDSMIVIDIRWLLENDTNCRKEQKIFNKIEEIKLNKDWFEIVNKKSIERKIPLDSMLYLDAKWTIENQK